MNMKSSCFALAAAVCAFAPSANAACESVGTCGLRGAFVQWPKLVGADFSRTLRIGDNGFSMSLCDCPKLEVADFSACTNAAAYAFCDSFVKCPSLSSVRFDSLTFAGDHAFAEAFRGSNRLESVSFPSLKFVGEECFNGIGVPVDLPKLSRMAPFAFRGYEFARLSLPSCTNVADVAKGLLACAISELDLPSLSTNDVESLWPIELRAGITVHCSDGDIRLDP